MLSVLDVKDTLVTTTTTTTQSTTIKSTPIPQTTPENTSLSSSPLQLPTSPYTSSLEKTNSKSNPQQIFGPYKLIKTIGVGEFGKVKLAVHLDTLKRVAIKLIKKESILEEGKKQKLNREIRILQDVSHCYIVKLLQVIETDNYIGIVLEFASGGELFEYIFKNKYLKEVEARKYFAQLLSGVSYLHSKNIVHRDLKLENLLLDEQHNLVITDFGFANKTGSDLLLTSCGSPCYAAPELVVSEGYKGEPADIWSCGIILYAMLCGYLPFDDDASNPDGENINLLYKYITESTLSFPAHVSSDAKSLLQAILVPNPDKRITMSQILEHPWIMPVKAMIEKNISEYTLKDSPIVTDAIPYTLKSAMKTTPVPIVIEEQPTPSFKPTESTKLDTAIIDSITHVDNVKDLIAKREKDIAKVDSSYDKSIPVVDIGALNISMDEVMHSSLHKNLPKLPLTAYTSLDHLSPAAAPTPKNKFNLSSLFKKSVHKPKAIRRVESSLNSHNFTPPLTPPTQHTFILSTTTLKEENDKEDAIENQYEARKSMALSRTSFATSFAGSQYSVMQSIFSQTGKLPKLRYHSGPTDNRALTIKDPMAIILDLEHFLIDLGYEVLIDSGKVFRLSVVRRQGFVQRVLKESDVHEENVYQYYDYTQHKSSLAKIFFEKVKMAMTYGGSWDKGYNGHQSQPSNGSSVDSKEEIQFSIEVQKIRRVDLYVVEFKRLRGDIWAFKKMYENLMADPGIAILIDSKYT